LQQYVFYVQSLHYRNQICYHYVSRIVSIHPLMYASKHQKVRVNFYRYGRD
jgi:hypothetical protein